MPIHDWTRVRANRYHDFHQDWTIQIKRALNAGVLPPGYLAMAEQVTGGPEPDVVTLALPITPNDGESGGLALADAPIQVRMRTESDAVVYSTKANRVAIRHPDGNLVAVIELVSPGNKGSWHAIRSFTREAVEFLHAGIHLLIVDPFPPSKRDPQGIHKAIWDRIQDEPFELPPDKPLTLAAYAAGTTFRGYVEPIAVGDVLPDMPIFLSSERYVPCPLEATYRSSWAALPAALKSPLEAPS